jgi:hypothetical protein
MASALVNKDAALGLPATPPRYSLLVAAPQLTDDIRWQGGIRWAPENNAGGGIVALDCHGQTATLAAGTNLTQAVADPFVVWAEDHCSTLGFQARDFVGRARRQLEATQSYRIAKELWSGAIAKGAADLDNHWLTEDPEIVTSGTTYDPIPALAVADQALGEMLAGRRGMIHVSLDLLTQLHANFGLEKSGDLWITAAGTIVVADAGYPGTGPDAGAGTNQWIYATPMIGYRLSAIDIIPGDLDSARAQALDKGVNLLTFYAERLALLQWDSTVPVGNHSNLPVVAVETKVPAFAFAA